MKIIKWHIVTKETTFTNRNVINSNRTLYDAKITVFKLSWDNYSLLFVLVTFRKIAISFIQSSTQMIPLCSYMFLIMVVSVSHVIGNDFDWLQHSYPDLWNTTCCIRGCVFCWVYSNYMRRLLKFSFNSHTDPLFKQMNLLKVMNIHTLH